MIVILLANSKKASAAALMICLIIGFVMFAGKSSIHAQALVHNPRFDGYQVLNGVDVSIWQTEVDWKKVKQDGIDFCIIRLGYSDHSTGVHNTDVRYYENLKNAKEAGLMVGVYYYSTALTNAEAKSEAEYVLKILGNTQLDLPVYMDQECSDGRVDPAKISKSLMTSMATTFCDTIRKGGYDPGFYSYISWLYNEVDMSVIESKDYNIWIANVTNQTEYEGEYTAWQYSFTGYVSGIPTNVDLDVMYVLGKPAKVTGLDVTNCGNKATLSWKAQSGITGYRVYKVDDNGKASKIATVKAPKTSYEVDATPVTAKYIVRAYRKSSDGTVELGPKSAQVKVQSQVPYELSAKPYAKSIKLSWKGVKNASGYVVFFDEGTQYTPIGYTNDLTMKITDLKQGKKYSFTVAAYYNKNGSKDFKEGYSKLSDVSKTLKTGTKNPAIEQITPGKSYYNGVALSWSAPPSGKVNGYRVYVLDKKTGKYKKLADVTETSTRVTGLGSAKKYSLMVRSYYKTKDMVVLSKNSELVEVITASSKPLELKAKTAETSIKLTWKQCQSGKEEGFRVYSYDAKTGKYTALADVTDRKYTVKSLNKTTPYTFVVKSFYTANGKKIWSQRSSKLLTGTLAPKVTGVQVLSNTSKTQTIGWNKVTSYKPAGYRLYSYDPVKNKYKKLCDTKDTSFKVKGLKAGTDTHYVVRAYYMNGKNAILSEYSKVLNCATSFAKVTGFKATKITKNSAKLSWTKTEGANGYIIYKVNKKGKAKVLDTSKKKSYELTGLKKNTSYSYQVRAFRKIGKVRYLGYLSEVLTFKTAKK